MGPAPMLGRPCLDRRWVRVSRRPRRSVSQRRSRPGRSGSSDPDLRWRPARPHADHAPKPPRQVRVSGLRRGCVSRLAERRPRRGALGKVAALWTTARLSRPVDARARRDLGCRDDRATRRVAGQPRRRVAVGADRRPRADCTRPLCPRGNPSCRSPPCAFRGTAVCLAGRSDLPDTAPHRQARRARQAGGPGHPRPLPGSSGRPPAPAPARPFSPAPPPAPAATHPGQPGPGAAHEFGFEG